MKKYLMAAAAVAALGSAAPASAQVGDVIQQGIQSLLGGGGISSRLANLDSQIRISFQRGEISQGEAARLRSELVELARLEQSYRIDGLNRAERFDLQQRLRMLERRIQRARFDRDDRFDDDDRSFGRNGCPPGLAKKNNGCLPPGQAKKGDRFNNQFGNMPSAERFRDTERFIYRQDGNRILQIDRRTGQVVRTIKRRR